MRSFRKTFQGAAALVCALILCAPLLSVLSPAALAEDAPEVASPTALLVDLDAGEVLYARNENESRAPASLAKIMTVLLGIEAYERGDVALTDLVDITETCFADVGSDGSTAGFAAGEQAPFEALLYSAVMVSGNEVCNAIAQRVSGDIISFVAAMNARAIELGCSSTNFANTHGMPNEHCYTTAHDLYVISAEAWKHNLFKRICSAQSYTIPPTNLNEERVIRTGNSLINEQSSYYYEYASGVKTGYTDAAGYCLVATASKEGRNLMAVVLGAQSVVAEDGRTEVQSFTDAKRLMNWGFDNFAYLDLLSTLDLIDEVPVKLGRGASSVVLRPENNVTALLPKDADLTKVELHHTVNSEESLTAPVEQGTVLGQISVTFEGKEYGTVNLVANTSVELDKAAYVGSEIRSTLGNKYVRLAITLLIILFILYIAFIIYYNVRRASKRRAAAALARRRVQEYRESADRGSSQGANRGRPRPVYGSAPSGSREGAAPERPSAPARPQPPRPAETTTGLTFEEIEAIFRQKDEEKKKGK